MSVNTVNFSAPMDEGPLGGAAADRHVGERHGVHEAGAGHVDVDDGRARRADRRGDDAGHVGRAVFGRRAGDDHEVDGGGIDAPGREGVLRCLQRHVGHRLVGSGVAASDDPGACPDPLVARLDDGGQLIVGDDPGRLEVDGPTAIVCDPPGPFPVTSRHRRRGRRGPRTLGRHDGGHLRPGDHRRRHRGLGAGDGDAAGGAVVPRAGADRRSSRIARRASGSRRGASSRRGGWGCSTTSPRARGHVFRRHASFDPAMDPTRRSARRRSWRCCRGSTGR